MNLLKRLWSEEEGQGMTEYGLIIALVALAVIGALGLLGPKIAQVFTNINNELPTTTP